VGRRRDRDVPRLIRHRTLRAKENVHYIITTYETLH
jgi:hypothetical protein